MNIRGSMTLETREKDISEFLVTFKAQPYNEVNIHSNNIFLGAVAYPGRVKALEVYQNITSTKDAKNFIEIVNNGEHSSFVMEKERGKRLMRIMELKPGIRMIRNSEVKS